MIQTFNFSQLSAELQARVLSFVAPTDYPNLSKVCKAFREFIYEKGLEGNNYKEFILSLHIFHSMKQIPHQIFAPLIPQTFSTEARDPALKNIYKEAEPLFETMKLAFSREFKDNFANKEILELAKLHLNPVLQNAMQKMGQILQNVAPIQEQTIKSLQSNSNFLSNIKQIITDAEFIQEEEDKKSAIDFGKRMSDVHGELLFNNPKIKAASSNIPIALPPVAPAAPAPPVAPPAPPVAPASSTRRYYLGAFAVAFTAFVYFTASRMGQYYADPTGDIV